jgi:hypothetical protein
MMIEKEMKMIKVNVGDTIRSYDFKPMVGREDCFVEGVVERMTNEQGYDAYKITVTKDSWIDETDPSDKGRIGKIVYVPVQVSFMEYAGRVINLSRI